ncbi:MAG: hypothetical protein Q4G70_10275 [Pseudomonadota bacterium]|nr:hypothetical protein [Pseudomonadota bacterium]
MPASIPPWWWLACGIALALLIAMTERARRLRWRPVHCRGCQGRAWRRAFPQASKADIRRVLALVGEAFGVAPRHRLKLHPNDRLLEIYRMNNPPRGWAGDALEFETLHAAVLTQYRIDLQPLWHDSFTVGDLLSAAQRPPTPFRS